MGGADQHHAPARITRRTLLTRAAGGAALALSTGCAAINRSQAEAGAAISMAINASPWLPSFRAITEVYAQETGRSVALRVFTLDALRSRALGAVQTRSDEFTIFNMSDAWASQFYDGGFLAAFRDIDPAFELPAPVIEYENTPRWSQQDHWFTPDGTVYGLPVNGNIQLLFHRADLYRRLDLAPPETWDDVIEAARRVRAIDDVYGFAMRAKAGGNAVTYDWLSLLRGCRGDVFVDAPRDYTVRINDDAGVQAAELFVELLSYGPPRPAAMGQAQVIGLMQAGRVLQAPLVTAAYPVMDSPTESAVPGKVDYVCLPRPANGVHATTCGIWLAGIPRHLPHERQRAAYDFLTWLLTPGPHRHYAEAGGIVTRRDVYESELAEQQPLRFMQAVRDSLPHLRLNAAWPIAPKVLEVTEPGLEAIASRSVAPQQGMDRIAAGIEKVVEESGVARA